jgi:prepilin-type N-terminal cleavage/methylation domain-containing protein
MKFQRYLPAARVKDARGFSAVELAVVLAVFALLLLLAWPQFKSWRQHTLNQQLVVALESEDRADVLRLLRKGVAPHGNGGPGTPLLSSSPDAPHCLQCQAVLWDDLDIARLVFPAPADGWSRLPLYHSPPFLNLAVARNSTEMATLLLDAGADLKERAFYAYPNRPPTVIDRNKKVMLELLDGYHRVEQENLETPKSQAQAARLAIHGFTSGDVIETEVTIEGENQYSVQVTNAVTFTLLHDAVLLGNEALLRLFLNYGADPSVRDHAGETPREYAERLGRANLAALLDVAEMRGR